MLSTLLLSLAAAASILPSAIGAPIDPVPATPPLVPSTSTNNGAPLSAFPPDPYQHPSPTSASLAIFGAFRGDTPDKTSVVSFLDKQLALVAQQASLPNGDAIPLPDGRYKVTDTPLESGGSGSGVRVEFWTLNVPGQALTWGDAKTILEGIKTLAVGYQYFSKSATISVKRQGVEGLVGMGAWGNVGVAPGERGS